MLHSKLHSDSELGSLSLFLFLLFPESYADADKKEAGRVRDSPCLVPSDTLSHYTCGWEGSEERQFDRNCKGAGIKLLPFIAWHPGNRDIH